MIVGEDQTAPTLPQELRSDVTVTEVSGTLVTLTAAVWGGAEFRNGSSFQCTSAFNVENPSTGAGGVSTAGHCGAPGDPLDAVLDKDGSPVSTTIKSQHRGHQGDFEWHTTPEIEPAKFFSSSGYHRDAESIKGWWFVNDWVCMYGRASDSPSCDRIYRTSFSTVDAEGYSLDHLVVTDDNHSILGDSGGPWYLGTQAIGVQTGYVSMGGANRDFFSRAARIDDALGVELRLASP